MSEFTTGASTASKSGDSGWSVGHRIKFDKNVTITELGVSLQSTTSTFKLALWDATTGLMIATGSLVGATTGWNWVSVPPTSLIANQEYLVSLYTASSYQWRFTTQVFNTWYSTTVDGVSFSWLCGYYRKFGDGYPSSQRSSTDTWMLGLRTSTTTIAPQVTIMSIDKTKISDETGMNTSSVVFKFDTDVQSWVVRVSGVDHTTGTLADSGSAVSANTEITAVVDYTELSTEGSNRVNIYGQSLDGTWTPFG